MAIRPIFQGYLSVVSTHESSTSSSIMMFCARLSGSSRSLMLSYLFPEPQKGHPWYPKGLRVPYHYRFCRPQEWFQNRSVTFVNSFVRPFAIGRADELRKKSLKIKQHEHLHSSFVWVYKAQSYMLRHKKWIQEYDFWLQIPLHF